MATTHDDHDHDRFLRTVFKFRHPRAGVAELTVGDLSDVDDLAVLRATGMPVQSFLGDQMGLASTKVLWWIARRHCGEPDLAFEDVPVTVSTMGDIEVEVIPPEDPTTPPDGDDST